jgi:hypothetical protein
MIKHIVMWKLKETEPSAKISAAKELKEALEGLKTKVPQVRLLEVGINFNPADTASDVSLYTAFDSQGDLDLYQKHPEHLKVVEVVKRLTAERRVSDYEE